MMRALLLLLAAALLPVSSSAATELLMFRRDGCPWCLAWTRELGPIYPKTDAGRRAPLRMVDIKRDRPDIALKTPIIYTPTFVLAEQGREVGRIEGYGGDQFFWGQLENLMQQLPPGSSSDLSIGGPNERSETKP
jgi:hypothetical protein